ncbi:MAG TPA: FAD/NAD(P)-binding oxidoreductase [Solirubrobacteraceae bacterium]|nr:FAD/NAD(P)-binding oxidoreductase [Solirubrobacteraceae bacterium]
MRVVVVGGGVGGLACVQRLVRRDGELSVTLVDRTLRHDFAPSFLWLMTGRRAPERVSRSLSPLGRAGVQLIEAEVTAVDPGAGRVSSTAGEIEYDQLVLAPGAALAPEAIPGLAQAAHGFYTREDAERLRDALAAFGGGRVLVAVAAMPFKCPAAPYEAAFLIADLLRHRGIAARVDIVTAEPQPLPVAGAQIGAQVAAMLAARRIGFQPGRQLESVDPDAREARFADGGEPYDLLVAVPPHRAPVFVADSPLAGPQGWIPVEAETLRAGENIHAIGDVTAIKLPNAMMLPKAGMFAHAQAEVVADNLTAAGKRAEARFDGHGACFLETGGGRAGFASGDFYASPSPALRMRRPARRWHWGKVLFERRWLARLR